jgi:hypothetical protein
VAIAKLAPRVGTVWGRRRTRVTLRAVLMLLAGTAVFTLALLPAHASADAAGSSHQGKATHPSQAHVVPHADDHRPEHRGHGAAHEHHQSAPDPAHADVPFCCSAQTSSALTSPQPLTTGITHLLTALLAAGLVALVVVLPFPHVWARIAPSSQRRTLPIRLESGPRLLLLDCIARV